MSDQSDPKSAKKEIKLNFSAPMEMSPLEQLMKNQPELFPLKKALSDATGKTVERAPALAFMETAAYDTAYSGIVKAKHNSIPDSVLKMIRIQDHLVAAILRTRGGQLSQFGKKRADRFDKGMAISIKPEFLKILNSEQFAKVTERIKRLEAILLN